MKIRTRLMRMTDSVIILIINKAVCVIEILLLTFLFICKIRYT